MNNPLIPGDPYMYDVKWIVSTLIEAIDLYKPLSQDFEDLKEYVDNYFANLDLSEEVQTIIDQMEADGFFDDLITEIVNNSGTIETTVTSWLNDNVNPVGSAVIVDNSLSIAGAAADAKTTGDFLSLKKDKGTIIDQASFSNVGYIDPSGNIHPNQPGWHYSASQPIFIDNDGYIYYNLWNTTAIALLTFYDTLGNVIETLAGTAVGKMGSGKYPIPATAAMVRACCKDSASNQFFAVGVKNWSAFIPSAIGKLNSWTGGNVVCAGDSIMKGYDPNGVIVSNPWINQFAAMTGINNVTNDAAGGQGFSVGSNTVITQLQNRILNTRSHIIIAAGTNDYFYKAPLTTFSNDVDTVISYLQTEAPQASIIFITPINRTTGPATPFYLLDEYSQIIAQKAIKAGFSVINGSKLPFPNDSAQTDYIQAIMTDGVHPTQLGYDIYAKAIYDIIGK